MSDMKCGRCADMEACTEHPEQIVGSRWQDGRVWDVRVVGVFPGRTDRWCVVHENGNVAGMFSMYEFDAGVRVPEVPAPMPTSDRELWVNVYPEGFDGYLGASQPSRKMAIARGAPGSLGVVQLAPVPESWQPAERSTP